MLGFFDLGNLITLGIVSLLFLFFRLWDRSNSSLSKLRNYAEKCKKEITAYAEEKRAAVKDFGIALDVEQKAASKLLRHIQTITREELAQKVQALTMIDERIRNYDISLEELVQMTGRVQENLNRIKEEADFVESIERHVGEAKTQVEAIDREIASMDGKLKTIEDRFKWDNAQALEKAAEEAVNSARSIVAHLESNAQLIDKKIEDQQEMVEQMAREKESKLLRHEEQLERLLADAVSRAGSKADKAEDAALNKLREQAQERLSLVKTHFEEKVKSVQDAVKAKLSEIQAQVKSNRDEWKAEAAAVEARQKAYAADWKQDIHDLDALAKEHKDAWNKDIEALIGSAKQRQDDWNKDIKDFTEEVKRRAETLRAELQDKSRELGDFAQQQKEAWNREKEELGGKIRGQREEWEASSRSIGLDIITATQKRLDEYHQAQEEHFRQLAGAANDTAGLEAELRRSMQEAENRVSGDFDSFGKEIHGKIQSLRNELEGVDREVTGIKEKAFDNVSQKLKGFEDEFLTNLSGRSTEIDSQLAAWQGALDKRLEAIAADSESKRQKAENRITEEIKKNAAAQGEKIMADLDRLKAEAAALEEGLRDEIHRTDESRAALREQFEHDLGEVKKSAANELGAKIEQYNLSIAETLRQNQRELEGQILAHISDTKEQIADLEASSVEFRDTMEKWQDQYNSRMKDLDTGLEDFRRRRRDDAVENEERIAAIRSSLDETRKEIAAQSKLFERTDALRTELDRYVEDVSGNIDRISLVKPEIVKFENQFTEIKRMADDVNAKMTRFLTEQRRIESMEKDFNRLLQTSHSVEEKLVQVSSSDDILQTMQVRIRQLEEAIKEAEEKYQRVEKKSTTLQETNKGIDRNFKALQEEEQAIRRLTDTISLLKTDMDAIQNSVSTLSQENEKARDAANKLSTLDDTVQHLEQRIAEMNGARESLARLATELTSLDKDAQEQLKLTRSLLTREGGKLAGRAGKGADSGAPPPRDKENIVKLKQQGWEIEEIAKAYQISKGEVELVLELARKDI